MTSLLNRFSRLAIVLALLGTASAAQAATVVKAELWDKGADMQMRTDLAYPASDAQHAAATMGIKLSIDHAKAGVVTFQVSNTSKDTIHEMVVARLAKPGQALPYSAKDQTVYEDKIAYVGEVSELDPGKTGTLTKPLKAGTYILMCNVAGHFAAGMWTLLTVN